MSMREGGLRMAQIRNRRILWAIPLVITVCLTSFPAQAKYGGGSGTAEDPYQIATAADLIALGDSPEDYDKHFILTANIDLGGHVFNKAVIAPDTDPNDMYSQFQGRSFTGVFDGDGNTISHLTITGADYLGLFGQLALRAEVKNLGVLDVNVTSWGGPVGGLVGSNFSGATVARCYSTGRISGPLDAGGLVGRNGYDGSVTQCYSTSAVSGAYDVGGFVGENSGTVTQCYSAGRVSGTGDFIGGLVGYFAYGTLSRCYSTSAVSGKNNVGGLVGYSPQGVVSACFWDIQTSGQNKSAGGKGKTTTEMQTASTFLEAGWDFIGEVQRGTHEVWQMPEGGGYPVLAALSGYTPRQLEGTGTAEDPYLISNELELGAMIYCNPHAHYRLAASIDLASIHWSTAVIPWFAGTFDGNGLTISNLTVAGGEYLGLFGQLEPGAEVKDLAVVDVNIAGSGYYVGGLAGYNSKGSINRCYGTGVVVSGSRYVGGLVGYNRRGAVSACYSTGAVGGNENVGGLVGSNGSFGILGASVIQCYSTSSVSGEERVGGLVGNNCGDVTQCYSTGVVSGESRVGGLVGYSSGVIDNCYSLASANGDNCVGGLAGHSNGRVSNSYSTGIVVGNDHFGGLLGYSGGSVTGCFWDTRTSGQATSAGGTGKTTCDLQMAGTFLGWGCSPAVWTIDEGVDYPRIAWEGKPGKALPALADFVVGSGSQADPYLIYTGEEFNLVGVFAYDWDKHFKLMADIDLSAYSGTAFNMIGSDSAPFTGIFDGNDHTISNFSCTCTGTSNVGLFGYFSGPNSMVKNLKLTWPDIDAGEGGNVGGLVGSLTGGTIANCHIDGGSVSGEGQVGGLVGTSYGGTITDCSSTATVSGNYSVGGLVGSNHGTITYCDSAGRVLGDYNVGGLVGTNGCLDCGQRHDEEPGTIYDSYSKAGVLGTGSNCGGLVGSNDFGEVARCYASGIVLSVSTVGGLAGWNGGSISSCYSTADVGGEKDVGGLVGLNTAVDWEWSGLAATITNCYSTGIVLGDEYVGGLVGEGDVNSVVASFWDIGTSGQEMSAGGIGKTTAEMQTVSTFVDAGLPDAPGWDFVAESQNGTEDIWAICEGVDYPHLAWEFVIGDFDADGDTDFADFCILAEHWLAADGSFWCDQGCDLTNDGSVNCQDLMVFLDNWLR
jgi:hypothetical protein